MHKHVPALIATATFATLRAHNRSCSSLSELLEDARGDGVTHEELESRFKSAQGYPRCGKKPRAVGAATLESNP